ncbi:50S ribosomal protein L9 [Commensalibacter nepenthis]|uniref:Large ribosomal subunit protein bL9 n=1 Tax=Commensalibacter nepenthis TaxID=3043872 RepID=A0ABT6Q660_9PROT|nr:50S ribosomal protein L9 [Commensalibacter sp. TBRC 10068]MDI2112373.1 50S ribosomal protein L9 [Commensalibacter sp. TBRC 10068]
MAATEVILLQRVEKLGQMGDVVKVKPGFARNYLLPQGKAIRATAANRERFERERSQLEAHNVKRREEAERLLERLHGLSVVIIRQAGESGNLYGSVTARDISEAAAKEGVSFSRQQVEIGHPIKSLGLYQVKIQLHPEVHLDAKVNVARSVEEAERQEQGEATQVETAHTHVDAGAVEQANAEMLENAPVVEEAADKAE